MPASSSGIIDWNTLSEKLAEIVHVNLFFLEGSSSLLPLLGALLAGRGQQRSSGYLRWSFLHAQCHSDTLNPGLKWLDPSIWRRVRKCVCVCEQGCSRWAGRDERPDQIIRWTDLILWRVGASKVGYHCQRKWQACWWFKADDKWNQVESPAETCNPEMIENGPVAVTAAHQLTKQQTDLSVTLANSSLWIFLES